MINVHNNAESIDSVVQLFACVHAFHYLTCEE